MKIERVLFPAILAVALLALGGCQNDTRVSDHGSIFGDGSPDQSRVGASVNGYDITENMLDMRFEELGPQERARFRGPEGRRTFVRHMVDEVVRVQEAEKRKLDLEPTVARVLIAQRRAALDLALRADLTMGVEPTIDEVRAYFQLHRENYVRLGAMNASHVECATREDAEHAYREIVEKHRALGTVAAEMSTNKDTKLQGGNLGWFNRGGLIPFIKHSKEFTERIWDLEPGVVNRPLKFRDHWHVIQVHERKYERQQTLEEVYPRVVSDLLPSYQATIIDEWMRSALAGADIEYLGEFRPGHGKSAKELFERAFYAKDPEAKLDLLALLVDDFPESEYADDALFMAGNIVLDTWGDRRRSSILLSELVKRYPDSAYREDTQFMLDHMDEPGMVQPKSIEELRKLSESQ